MPLISIIVPVYKVEPYLRDCINSVLEQTFNDYECILVDDGSPDNCPAICDEYSAKDARFSVIHKQNGGLSDARNAGIRAATGEYIVLLDSDDMFADNEALSNLAKIIMNCGSQIIFNCNIKFIHNNTKTVSMDSPLHKHVKRMASHRLYTYVIDAKCCIGSPFYCARRSLLISNQLFFKTGILHEDEHWLPQLIRSVDFVDINHNLFYAYRVGRNDSIMSRFNIRNIRDLLLIMNDSQKFSEDDIFPQQNRVILKYRNAHIWYVILYRISEMNFIEYCDVLEELNRFKHVLRYGKKMKYKILYILTLILGVKRFAIILKPIIKIHKKIIPSLWA